MTTYKEPTSTREKDLFETETFTHEPIIIRENTAVINQQELNIDDSRLDRSLEMIKWLFFFAPGCLILHLAISGGVFLASIDYSSIAELPSVFLFFIVGMFLMMLGIGKLSDLRYLKAVAWTAAVSFILSILILSLSMFSRIDFFGLPLKISLLLIVVTGQLAKNIVDDSLDVSCKATQDEE